MPLDPDLETWLALSLSRGLTPESFRRLLLAFRSPQAILSASRSELSRVVAEKAVAAILERAPRADLETVAGWLEEPANRVLTLAESDYPQSLLQMPDPPPVLYAKGRVELLNRPCFAIVGSRNATHAGIRQAEAFGRTLSDAGFVVVSGLALGIDAAAHRGALAGGASTIAVVGTGLDIVYPARNRELAHEIAGSGCLISEFPLGTPPASENFPRRNRLISGLSRGCLVVEAALSSGSLITARLANEQGKEVFAMPGSVHSPLAKGCHRLIKQGAKLAESAEDILEELQMKIPARHQSEAAGGDPHPVLEHLGFDPCDFDTLVMRSGLSADALGALLTQWEIEGLVEALPGGRYQRVR
ncbi:MAG: DNA-processing protein DprA [Burkholderiales bacterium]